MSISLQEIDTDMVVVTTAHEPPAIHAFGEAAAWNIEDGILTVIGSSGKQLGSWAPGFWSSVRLQSARSAFAALQATAS